MDTLKKSPVSFDVHEIMSMRDTFTIEWGNGEEPEFDRAAYEEIFTEALEEDKDIIAPLFASLGIEVEVLSGEFAGFEKEIAVFYLISEDTYYGCLLVTEDFFEWRKEGFAPIELKNLSHLSEFCEFLSCKKYLWKNQIGDDKPVLTGISDAHYMEHGMKWIRKGFLRNHDHQDIFTYVLIGNL